MQILSCDSGSEEGFPDDSPSNHSCGVKMPARGFGLSTYCLRGGTCAVHFLIGVIFFSAVCSLPLSKSKYGDLHIAASSEHSLRSKLLNIANTTTQLLKSQELSEAVAQIAVRAVEAAAKLQQLGGENMENTQQQLPSDWKKQVQAAAVNNLGVTVDHLTHASAGLHSVLHEAHVTPQQAAALLDVLHALIDNRVLAVGVEVIQTCAVRTPEALQACVARKLEPRDAELRKLREELLPNSLQVLTEGVKANHMQILRHHTIFKASGDVGAWHAEVEIQSHTQRRKLHEPAAPWHPIMSVLPRDQAQLALPSAPVSQNMPATPINWYTVGAPAVSSGLGLLFLCLMALLPGPGGHGTNRAVANSLWGLQWAGTIGECFANFGLNKGIMYLAPCMIDAMFLGMEVIWVFFDGPSVARRKRITDCSPYVLWLNVTGLCGNCIAITTSQTGADSCDLYCASIGHRCRFASLAAADTCFAKAPYRCNEVIPVGAPMLCQCSAERQLKGPPDAMGLAAPLPNVQMNPPIKNMQMSEVVLAPHDRQLQGIWNSNFTFRPFPQQCVHSEAVLIVVICNFTSTPIRAIPLYSFLVSGLWTDPAPLTTDIGTRVFARVLLAAQPTKLRLIANTSSDDEFRYQTIFFRNDRFTTPILSDPTGLLCESSSLWLGAAQVQEFNVPDIFSPFPSLQNRAEVEAAEDAQRESFRTRLRNRGQVATASTSVPPLPTLPGNTNYILELVTRRDPPFAQQSVAATTGGAFVQFRVDGQWTDPQVFVPGLDASGNGNPVLAGECVAANFSLPSRPSDVRITYRPAQPNLQDPWQWERIVLLEGPFNLLTLVVANSFANPIQLAPPSEVEFEIGAGPTVTTTTSTSTTSTSTATSTTITTGTFPPVEGTIQCSDYASWPNIQGDACGGCRARVPIRCSDYCDAFNHTCFHSALPAGSPCQLGETVQCSQRPRGPEGIMCTCGLHSDVQGTSATPVAPVSRCRAFSQWPAISVNTCGGCMALIPVGPNSESTLSCHTYCDSFKHVCELAAEPVIDRTTPCEVRRQLNCTSSTSHLAEVLCKCVEP